MRALRPRVPEEPLKAEVEVEPSALSVAEEEEDNRKLGTKT